jgi:hypothetical protein
VSQGAQGVPGNGRQVSRGPPRNLYNRPAGGLFLGSPQLQQLTRDPVQRTSVAGRKKQSDRLIRPGLAFRPQPQRGEQLRGFVDEATAGFGVA